MLYAGDVVITVDEDDSTEWSVLFKKRAEEYALKMSPHKTKSDSILHGYLILKAYVPGPTSLDTSLY